mmetsp:Transcript_4490/g.11980  ORF Transcript_4490/g.11980 Transcript_4490/m.11980 type:complete len:268 (-) Transcript_4490:223-1026(-)
MRPAPIRILPGRSRHAPRRLASARCTTGHAHNVSTREGGSLLRMHHTRSGTAAPRVPGSCAWRPLVSLTLLLLLLLLLRVVEQSLELSAHHCGEHGCADTRGDEVEEGRLRGVEEMHHADGGREAERVRDHVRVEVGHRSEALLRVESDHERYKDARDDNVAEAEHRARHRLHAERLGKEDLDGCVDALGDRHHHLGAKDPEYVVEEEAHEQQDADQVRAKREHLDTLDGERATQQVVDPPLFGDAPPHRDAGAAQEEHHVQRAAAD